MISCQAEVCALRRKDERVETTMSIKERRKGEEIAIKHEGDKKERDLDRSGNDKNRGLVM